MKKSNTKKNKMCFTIPEELEPFSMIKNFIILDTVIKTIQVIGEGIGDNIGDISI